MKKKVKSNSAAKKVKKRKGKGDSSGDVSKPRGLFVNSAIEDNLVR